MIYMHPSPLPLTCPLSIHGAPTYDLHSTHHHYLTNKLGLQLHAAVNSQSDRAHSLVWTNPPHKLRDHTKWTRTHDSLALA